MATPRFANVLRPESGLQYASKDSVPLTRPGSFRKNPLRIADMSHRVAIPDSGNAVLYGQPYHVGVAVSRYCAGLIHPHTPAS